MNDTKHLALRNRPYDYPCRTTFNRRHRSLMFFPRQGRKVLQLETIPVPHRNCVSCTNKYTMYMNDRYLKTDLLKSLISVPYSPPMDGKWSRWTKYSSCSVTCGGGMQHRTRLCDNPPPSNGGNDCVGRNRMTRRCAEWNCPGK